MSAFDETVLILAHGPGLRWSRHGQPMGDLPESKHMLPVAGLPLLWRTVGMLSRRGRLAFVHAEATLVGTRVTAPGLDENTSLLGRIAGLSEYFGNLRTTILLGDVLFSHAALDSILGSIWPLQFLGRTRPNPVTGKEGRELYGLSAAAPQYPRLIQACQFVSTRGQVRYENRLWGLLGCLQDSKGWPDPALQPTDDYTDDVDSPEEFDQFWSALRAAAEADDEAHL